MFVTNETGTQLFYWWTRAEIFIIILYIIALICTSKTEELLFIWHSLHHCSLNKFAHLENISLDFHDIAHFIVESQHYTEIKGAQLNFLHSYVCIYNAPKTVTIISCSTLPTIFLYVLHVIKKTNILSKFWQNISTIMSLSFSCTRKVKILNT